MSIGAIVAVGVVGLSAAIVSHVTGRFIRHNKEESFMESMSAAMSNTADFVVGFLATAVVGCTLAAVKWFLAKEGF